VEKNDAMRKLIHDDEDFINAPKFGNSLDKFLAKNDNLLENGAIGRLLLLSEEEVEEIYQESVVELRKAINPDGEE
jgi:hypothetical protein